MAHQGQLVLFVSFQLYRDGSGGKSLFVPAELQARLEGGERAVLRRRDRAGLWAEEQPGLLQVCVPGDGVFKAHAILFPAAGQMR